MRQMMRSIARVFHKLFSSVGFRRLGLGLLVFILMGIFLSFPVSEPSTPASGPGEASAQSADPTQTPTLDPVSEILANRSQTNGIILGAVVLMGIILFATLGSLRRRPAPSPPENPPTKDPY